MDVAKTLMYKGTATQIRYFVKKISNFESIYLGINNIFQQKKHSPFNNNQLRSRLSSFY